MNLESVDALAKKHFAHYKDNWYKYGKPQADEDFVMILRDSSCDLMFLGETKSYENLLWLGAVLSSERVVAAYYVKDGKAEQISKEDAEAIRKESLDSLSEEYIDLCKSCDACTYMPTLKEYSKFKDYEQNQRNHGLAVPLYWEWIIGERGLL